MSYLLVLATALLASSFSCSQRTGVAIELPERVTIELPREWTVLSQGQRFNLDSWVKQRGIEHDTQTLSRLGFAANYYDQAGKTAAMVNVRYYPDSDFSQAAVRSLSPASLRALDAEMQNTLTQAQAADAPVLEWSGTRKASVSSLAALVTEYRRFSRLQNIGFKVRLVRVPDTVRSFTLTLSVRDDEAGRLGPVIERIQQSLSVQW